MKKILLLAVAMIATLSVSAQSEPGKVSIKPMVGMTMATFRGGDVEGAKMKIGLVAGAEAIYQVSDMFGLSAGLLYSMQGSKGEDDTKVNTEYLNIPVLANIYLAKGLALKAGVQLGLLTKAKGEYKFDGVKESTDIKDYMKSTDFSIPVGLSYEINNSFTIDARYNFGLSKLGKESESAHSHVVAAKAYNSVFMLTLGYKFDL